ncbi:lectin MVL [Ahniella affigens]|uniref:Lectin MVL n=2 Tax=Ahniella affigens TaxID=2021234 RepID=A0A2P1PZ99_9GAMM|nr:lectin MVL [Ahniella affigens]
MRTGLNEGNPESTFKIRVPAGFLSNNDEAQALGPRIAAARQGRFTGKWTTVLPGEMSVVEVELSTKTSGSNTFKTDVLAGPIRSNEEAQKIGPNLAASYGGRFTGQWNTIVVGVMSVIQVEFTF